ncbi:MAG: hypothetical protein ACRER2_11675, partial [Methylococcales bacterium]
MLQEVITFDAIFPDIEFPGFRNLRNLIVVGKNHATYNEKKPAEADRAKPVNQYSKSRRSFKIELLALLFMRL